MVKKNFKLHNPIGLAEVKAASRVIKSGNLSGFYAQSIDNFLVEKGFRI